MSKKEFDYIQVANLVDHRPFVAPGQIAWMQAMGGKTYIKLLAEFPGVEGIAIPYMQDEELPFLHKVGDEYHTEKRVFKVVTLDLSYEATNGYYTNDQGVGCMIRFNGIARSVFIPYAAMLMLYKPEGVNGHQVLGYDTFAGRMLVQFVTPGMMEAMLGKGVEIPSTDEAPKEPEQPKPRPNHLKRVQ